MAETQNTNIEMTSGNTNYDEQIASKLEEILGAKFSILENNGSLENISSLDEETKKILLNILESKPEAGYELLDNKPIDEKKVKRIIKVNSTEAKEENKDDKVEDKTKQIKKESLQKKFNENFLNLGKELSEAVNLKQNPNYEKYQQQAQEELLKSTPGLQKNPNFQSYVDIYILVQHQNEFLAGRPELKDKFAELTKMSSTVEAFRNIRIDNYIDRNFSNTALERDKDKIKAGFMSNSEVLEIDGKEFKLGDQVQVYDESGAPKRFIERYGWRMASDARFETKYPFQFERDNIIKEHTKAKSDYRQTTDKLVGLKTDIEKLDRQISSLNPKDEGSKMQIETLQAEKKKLVEDFDKTKTKWLNQEQLVKALEGRAIDLESKEQQRVGNYRDQLNDSDEKTRGTLEFLNNIGITNISQQDFETMMSVVNSKYLTKSGFSKPFSFDNLLEKPSGDEFRYQRELISFFNKLLGLEGADAINPENVGKYVNGSDKSFTDNDFSQKVRDTLYTGGIFNTSLLETRFGGGNNEEAKK